MQAQLTVGMEAPRWECHCMIQHEWLRMEPQSHGTATHKPWQDSGFSLWEWDEAVLVSFEQKSDRNNYTWKGSLDAPWKLQDRVLVRKPWEIPTDR